MNVLIFTALNHFGSLLYYRSIGHYKNSLQIYLIDIQIKRDIFQECLFKLSLPSLIRRYQREEINDNSIMTVCVFVCVCVHVCVHSEGFNTKWCG